MNISVSLSVDELEELNMTEDELESEIIERLDSANPDLPGYNVWIEVERPF